MPYPGRVRHLQGTPLVAVLGVRAILRGLQAGRVMRLLLGCGTDFLPLSAIGASAIAFVDIDKVDQKEGYI